MMSVQQTWTVLRDKRPETRHQHRLPTAGVWPAGTIIRCPCGKRFVRLERAGYPVWARRWLPWPR